MALSFGWATRPALKGVLSLLGFPPPSSLGDAALLVVPLLVSMVAAVTRVQATRKHAAGGEEQVRLGVVPTTTRTAGVVQCCLPLAPVAC